MHRILSLKSVKLVLLIQSGALRLSRSLEWSRIKSKLLYQTLGSTVEAVDWVGLEVRHWGSNWPPMTNMVVLEKANLSAKLSVTVPFSSVSLARSTGYRDATA